MTVDSQLEFTIGMLTDVISYQVLNLVAGSPKYIIKAKDSGKRAPTTYQQSLALPLFPSIATNILCGFSCTGPIYGLITNDC